LKIVSTGTWSENHKLEGNPVLLFFILSKSGFYD
jgi:hypothetical protein